MDDMAYEDALVFEYMLRTEQSESADVEASVAMLDVVAAAMEAEQARLYGRGR